MLGQAERAGGGDAVLEVAVQRQFGGVEQDVRRLNIDRRDAVPAREPLVRADRVEVIVGLETGVKRDRFIRPHDEVRGGVVGDVAMHQKETRAPAVGVVLLIQPDADVPALERQRVSFRRICVRVNVAGQAKRQLILGGEREVAGVQALERRKPTIRTGGRLPVHVPALKQHIGTTASRPGLHESFPGQQQPSLRQRHLAEVQVALRDNADVAGLSGIP